MSDPLKLMCIRRAASGRRIGARFKSNGKYMPALYEVAIKTYEVQLRKRDSVPIYRLVAEEDFKTCAVIPNKYDKHARLLAEERGLPFVSHTLNGRVKQNRVAVLDPVSLFVLYSKQEPKKKRKKHREAPDVAKGMGEEGKGEKECRPTSRDNAPVEGSVSA